MIEFKTWEDDDNTIIEARLRLTARECIPNYCITTSSDPYWIEKTIKKQLASKINNRLYGEITDRLLNLNDRISKMVYSDSCTRIDIIKELHKDINEVIRSYDNI